MIINIIRWLKGYIVFTAIGKFPERFINLMNINGIPYWNSRPCKGGFTATMFLQDYRCIRNNARKSKVRLKADKKIGFPFFVAKYKMRKGIAIGLAIAILLVNILSQFVWVVDIKGMENISRQEVMPVLKSNGLEIGVMKKSVDIHMLERNILLQMPELKWVSVNLLNNVATVEIKEKDPKPQLTEKHPCNIKAACDGIITKASVTNGTNQIKPGSAVVKNQVLVNSVMSNGEESVKYVHSQAEIYADVSYKKTLSIEKNKAIFILEEKYSVKKNGTFLWFSFPIKFSSSQSNKEMNVYNNYRFVINNVTLPIGYKEEICYYYNKELKNSDYKKTLKNKLALYEIFNENESAIKSRKIRFVDMNEKVILKADYLVNKDIAVEQKIHVEY